MKCYDILSLILFFGQSFAKEATPAEEYHWKELKYEFQQVPPVTGYNPKNDRVVGIEINQYRGFFLSVSHAKDKGERPNGTLSALNFISRNSDENPPLLQSYPDPIHFRYNKGSRMVVDNCGRLWFVDNGNSKLIIVDVNTKHVIKQKFLPVDNEGDLQATLVVDTDLDNCSNAYAYISILPHPGILVYTLRSDQVWTFDKITPRDTNAQIGIASLALREEYPRTNKLLFIHPHQSPNLYSITTDTLKGAGSVEEKRKEIKFMGAVKGLATSSRPTPNVVYFSRDNDVLFYTVGEDSIGCWNYEKYSDQFSENTTAVIRLTNTTDGVISDFITDGYGRGNDIQDVPTTYFNNIFILKTNGHNTGRPTDQAVYKINVADLVNGTVCELPEWVPVYPFGGAPKYPRRP